MHISDDGNITFTMEEGTRPPGRTRVLVPADCPACGRPLKVDGWGYPRLDTGDHRLHCMRCVRPGTVSRRDLADGRRTATGLPRGITRARRAEPCAGCVHPILPGHLIEAGDGRQRRHVKCPSVCVRCEVPIARGQRFRERMAEPHKTPFGWKHERCDYVDLLAKRERDAAVNAERQRRAAESARNRAPGRGRQIRE